MIGAVLALHMAFTDHRPAWCESVRQVAVSAAIAHKRRVPLADVQAAAEQLPDLHARRDGMAAIFYAYVGNDDDKLTPKQLGELVYRVCRDPGGNL